MTSQASKFGIYLNARENVVVRITSPYWLPEPPDWVLLTDEVNAPLTKLRQMVREQGLTPDPDALRWGSIPLREGA